MEGLGDVFIQDVTTNNSSILSLAALKQKRREIEAALARAQNSHHILYTHITGVVSKGFDMSQMETTLDEYNMLCEKVDLRILDLQKELEQVTKQIPEGNPPAYYPNYWQVSFNVPGEIDKEVKIYIKYSKPPSTGYPEGVLKNCADGIFHFLYHFFQLSDQFIGMPPTTFSLIPRLKIKPSQSYTKLVSHKILARYLLPPFLFFFVVLLLI